MSKHETVEIETLRPNPWNTNRVSPDHETKLDASIRRFGVFKPIVVREIEEEGEVVLEIIGGEHRWDSAKRVGLFEIPIFNLGAIGDDHAKEIMLADNARYGSDDALLLAELLQDMENVEDFETFLPMTDTDLKSIFAATNIALDSLEIPESLDADADPKEEPIAKAARTHTMMKFKVPVTDAEKITALVTKIQQRHGFTTSDELSNAGDALVHLLLSKSDE